MIHFRFDLELETPHTITVIMVYAISCPF